MNRILIDRHSNGAPSAFVQGVRMVSGVCVLALTLGVATAAASPLDRPEDGRVRASKPTVMTVEDKSNHVDPDQKLSRPNLDKKKRRSFFFGPAKAWNGLVEASGKMLLVDQDVPSQREREARQKAPQQ